MSEPGIAVEPDAVLTVRRITKRFPGLLANDEVDFDLQQRRGALPARRERRGQDHAR